MEYVTRKLEGKVEMSMNSSTYYVVQTKTPSHTYRATGPLTLCWRECKNAAATLKDRLVISYETIHTLITWSNNHMIFMQMNWKFMSTNKIVMLASFIIVQTWKQSRCPSTGKRKNKFWFSAMRTNSYQDMEDPEMHITKWHKAIEKGYRLVLAIWQSEKAKEDNEKAHRW